MDDRILVKKLTDKLFLMQCIKCGKEFSLPKWRHNKGRGRTCSRHCGNWKNGKGLSRNGYIVIFSPNHPHGENRLKRYVKEHRLVMEKKIGRYLTSDEVVHHINCIKTDNRIENLMIVTRAEHRLIHIALNKSNI